MCAAGENKILVSALHYTLINLLLLSHLESCWETRPDSAMPGQAVSPSGCWHRSNRPDKKDPAETTRHWQAFNTAEQTDTHPPPSFHSLHSVPRSDTLHTSTGRTVANYHLTALLPGETVQLSWPPSFIPSVLRLCHFNLLSGLQYLSFSASLKW